MTYLNFLARFLVLAILVFLLGCTKSFEVEDAGKMQEFYIRRPYFSIGIDYPVKLTVTGKIDGRGLIYITPSATAYNSSYSIPFGPNDKWKTLVWQISTKKNVIIYKPTTVKKGKLTIKVEFKN